MIFLASTLPQPSVGVMRVSRELEFRSGYWSDTGGWA